MFSSSSVDGGGVDPLFTGFYQSLGGAECFGDAISPLFLYNGDHCQYVEAALLCYQSDETPAQQFILFPLGSLLGLQLDPNVDSSQAAIYEEFQTLYQQLGATLVGLPLTAVRVDYNAGRIEQYFENIGFYRNFTDPLGQANLLPYGSQACDRNCNVTADTSFSFARNPGFYQPFLAQVAQLNGLEVFGQPLCNYYLNANGEWEQVYSNVALVSPAGEPQSVRFLPLGHDLGALVEEPVADVGDQPGMYFYPVGTGRGYYIPLVFKTFIDQHGGMLMAGEPVSGVVERASGIFRQCFENYCLDYDNTSSTGLVRMTAIGAEYLERTHPELLQSPAITDTNPEAAATEAFPEVATPLYVDSTQEIHSVSGFDIQIEETYPQIPSGRDQSITITILDQDTQNPVEGIIASLLVQYPDGGQYTSDFPASDAHGLAVVNIPSHSGIANARIVPYRICIQEPGGNNHCEQGAYLIWNGH